MATLPLIIAHRGESRDAPENTLASIRLAWQRGADAVEIDVRRTADDQLAVIHDADTGQFGERRRLIARQTAAELAALDAGRWKAPRWAGERIPLLAEVLPTIPRRGRLFVEIKDGPDCVPPLQVCLAKSTARPAQVLLMSFNVETVRDAARAFPEYEACLLLEAKQWVRADSLARSLELARALGCRSVDLEKHDRLDRTVVETAHAAGLRVYVWTVNRAATARRLAAAGVDGITTDRCAWMRRQLELV